MANSLPSDILAQTSALHLSFNSLFEVQACSGTVIVIWLYQKLIVFTRPSLKLTKNFSEFSKNGINSRHMLMRCIKQIILIPP